LDKEFDYCIPVNPQVPKKTGLKVEEKVNRYGSITRVGTASDLNKEKPLKKRRRKMIIHVFGKIFCKKKYHEKIQL